jgi:hypothetical protein
MRSACRQEADGMNETLIPLDYKSAGQIEDDEINRILVNPLPSGARLVRSLCISHSIACFFFFVFLSFFLSLNSRKVTEWRLATSSASSELFFGMLCAACFAVLFSSSVALVALTC